MSPATTDTTNFLAYAEAHDQIKHLWDDLHQCRALVSIMQQAFMYEDGGNSSDFATVLDLVEKKLMHSINSLDNLCQIDFQKAASN